MKTNKEAAAEASTFTVDLEGLAGAVVTMPELTLEAEETRTIPLIVRLPNATVDSRTIPFRVRVSTTTGEIVLPTTFKTGEPSQEAP